MLRALTKALGSKGPEEKIESVTFYLTRVLDGVVREAVESLRAFAQELREGRIELGPDTPSATLTRVSLRTGIGVPPATLGNDGDLYWNTQGLGPPTIYLKAGGAWMVVV